MRRACGQTEAATDVIFRSAGRSRMIRKGRHGSGVFWRAGKEAAELRRLAVHEYTGISGMHVITFENFRFQSGYLSSMDRILKTFLTGEELFFGFYRTDGVNLTAKRERELKSEIPAFFRSRGEIQALNEYLTVARIKAGEDIYHFIPSVFDYYLETVLFYPVSEWETFKRFYRDYQKHRLDEMVSNHFAELLFCYSDSGDFSVCFDPERRRPADVRNTAYHLVFDRQFREQ